LSFLSRIFGDKRSRDPLRPLYAAIVERARDPFWYQGGEVPDTLDGRFDMVTAVLTLVLLRMEAEGEEGRRQSVLLTELFVDDMDGTVRQIGIGDLMVGKHVGRMMSALGGRLSAFRAAADGSLEGPVRRNIFHDAPPSEEAVRTVADRLAALRGALAATPGEALLRGEVPAP
jgi:cytochrome b pre-mRNA-processing protein 3